MGKVLAERADGQGVILAAIDVDYARSVRAEVGFFQYE
jgi:hypothetical protein